MMTTAALVLALALQADPAAKWKVDFKLSFEQRDGFWIYSIEGTTNVPDAAVLRARIYALEVVDDFRVGKREDEEPLVWEDDEGQPAHKVFSPVAGKFKEEVYRFTRKPYALLYRARVHYLPRDQSAEVLAVLGNDDFSRHTDLRTGPESEFAEQLRTRVAEVTADLIEIEKLYGELRRVYEANLKTHEPAAWKAWKEPWFTRVEKIGERNKERFNLWAVWMERQARMRVGGMCELLRRILVSAGEVFGGAGDRKPFVEQMITGFLDYFEEAIEVIGVNIPLDPNRVGPLQKAYDAALEPLRQALAKDGADLSEARLTARRQGYSVLLRYPPLLQNRKRGYLYVNEISARFTRLLEQVEAGAPAETLKKALADHDRALAEFKEYAGLK